MKPIIRVENLSKEYRLGANQTPQMTFRETLMAAVKSPVKKLKEKASRGEDSSFWALNDVNFDIMPGEVVGIIGRNGAGKSTLLKILSRITEPTTGKIELYGRVGSLLEVGTGFHPELSGRENIFLNGAILGMRREEIAKKFDEIVDFAEVEKFIDTPVKFYSSGMYTRLAFAVAANLEPEILIVDEVLAVGDAEFQKKCLGKMKSVSDKEGRTVLFVSHSMSSIIKLCDRCIFLQDGSVGLDGNVREAIRLYNNEGLSDNILYQDETVKRISAKQNGNLIEITVLYEHTDILTSPNLGFVISDSNGYPVYGTNTKMSYLNKLSLATKKGQVTVVVKDPKLVNGIYKLSIWFGNEKQDFFHRKDCLSIEVIDKSGSAQLPATIVGHAIPRCEWSFS